MKPGYEQIRNDREINLLIEQGNRNLKVLGYTCLLYTSDAADEL